MLFTLSKSVLRQVSNHSVFDRGRVLVIRGSDECSALQSVDADAYSLLSECSLYRGACAPCVHVLAALGVHVAVCLALGCTGTPLGKPPGRILRDCNAAEFALIALKFWSL
jgi:hypothetical protein